MKTYNIFVYSFSDLSESAKVTALRDLEDHEISQLECNEYIYTKSGNITMLPSGAVPAPAQILFSYNELSDTVKYNARLSVGQFAARSKSEKRLTAMEFIYTNPLLFLKDGSFVNHLHFV